LHIIREKKMGRKSILLTIIVTVPLFFNCGAEKGSNDFITEGDFIEGDYVFDFDSISVSEEEDLSDVGFDQISEDFILDEICPPDKECAGICCGEDEICLYEVCISESLRCSDDNDCGNDSYCDKDSGLCVPYGWGPRGNFNPDCTHVVTVARFSPVLQCSFTQAPPGDPFPSHIHVLSTPLVVDFNFNNNPSVIRPSIVATFDDGVDGSSEQPTGLIRILDGRDCRLLFNLDAHMVSHSSPPAVGDLDLDGTPEIVAYSSSGGLVAFKYDRSAHRWNVFWESHYPDGTPYRATGGGWAGPSIHDLDDDGIPEVLRGGVIFDSNGTLVGGSLGYKVYSAGIFPVVADVDLDGIPELVTGNMIYGFDSIARDWVPEPYFNGTGLSDGHTAIGDFGDFPLSSMESSQKPEVVVVSGGYVRVQTIEGQVIFPQTALPAFHSGCGGPPTIADFDGDGRAEFAVAGYGSYTVFDFDCLPDGNPAGCVTGSTNGILWTKPSQDHSSCVTGSSVFDFEGDGKAEAIYADECFVRVYDGRNGDVIYSQYRSSCTWYENPVVADCDGDFNSELIVPSNKNCSPPENHDNGRPCEGLDTGNLDPQFPGLRCEVAEDCASGICDSGYCRCAVTDDCCIGGCGDTGFVCAPPVSGTPGTGNVCRAAHPHGTAGIRVYRDAADRWVDSRPIWNQHAYHVTHVENNGTIPRTSRVAVNWLTPGLNNFRQNVMGNLEHLDDPDMTSGGGSFSGYCSPNGSSIQLEVLACNRGTQPVDSGIEISFFRGNPDEGGTLICSTETTRRLEPGQCESVGCEWNDPPTSRQDAVTVWVTADSANESSECFEENNWSEIPDVYCEMPI